MAFVTADDGQVCIVRPEEVVQALAALYGSPRDALKIMPRIEYGFRSAVDVASMEAFDKAGINHGRNI